MLTTATTKKEFFLSLWFVTCLTSIGNQQKKGKKFYFLLNKKCAKQFLLLVLLFSLKFKFVRQAMRSKPICLRHANNTFSTCLVILLSLSRRSSLVSIVSFCFCFRFRFLIAISVNHFFYFSFGNCSIFDVFVTRKINQNRQN